MVKHLACIMDGNRRWAKQHGMFPWDGHKEGVKAAQRVVDFCVEQHIPYLSLYTFSLENFNRSYDEQYFLFSVLLQEVEKRVIAEFIERGIRIQFIGDRTKFPETAISAITNMQEATKHGTVLTVNLLFCYGGRQEIMHGVQSVMHLLKKGAIAADTFTDEEFEKLLWTHGIPAPDIILRTGGVRRLSNFLLYQAAYSELFFLDEYWPEISHEHLKRVLSQFNATIQNFGK